jgi:effector-binding domain-containing protein
MRSHAVLPLLVALPLLAAAAPAIAYESLPYRVLATADGYEVREVAAHLAVETTVEGSYSQSRNRAFRRLFDYIQGNNTARRKIAMTVPVTSEPTSQKVAMTVPVTSAPAGAGHSMQFVLPSEFTRETAPLPKDPEVRLVDIPAEKVAVRRFSGLSSESNWRENEAALLEALRRDGLEPAGTSRFAVYNGPLTPWFMRRNEVLVPLR